MGSNKAEHISLAVSFAAARAPRAASTAPTIARPRLGSPTIGHKAERSAAVTGARRRDPRPARRLEAQAPPLERALTEEVRVLERQRRRILAV